MPPEVLFGMLGALGGGSIAAIITVIASRQSRQTDVTETVTGMFHQLAEGLRKDLTRAREDLEKERAARILLGERFGKLEDLYHKLRRHNEMLSSQVVDLGGRPLPMPD